MEWKPPEADFFLEGSSPGGSRDPRFPRCWRVSDGREVTDDVWYLNRSREPHPRAVIVNGRGVEVAAVLVSDPNPPPPPPAAPHPAHRGGYRRATPAVHARILELWNEGRLTTGEIAAVLGVSYGVAAASVKCARRDGKQVREGLKGRPRH